jgi:hypothetical protein
LSFMIEGSSAGLDLNLCRRVKTKYYKALVFASDLCGAIDSRLAE